MNPRTEIAADRNYSSDMVLLLSSSEKGLVEQEYVQGDDQGDHDQGHGGGQAVVDQGARLRQNIRSGIRAKGMPKESTTWLMTRARLGFTPTARTPRAGAIVTSRRRKSGMRRLMNPCIITCPLIVPTEELEKPLASKATPKRVAERPPT